MFIAHMDRHIYIRTLYPGLKIATKRMKYIMNGQSIKSVFCML